MARTIATFHQRRNEDPGAFTLDHAMRAEQDALEQSAIVWRGPPGVGKWPRLSEAAAQRRASVYFLLVAAAVWFGTMGGAKEIVNEIPVARREVRTGVDPLAFMASKAISLVGVTGIQTGLLAALVSAWVLHLTAPQFVILWTGLGCTAVASSCLGLLVSCSSPTFGVALSIVPVIMIPQLMLGGLLRPVLNTTSEYPLARTLSACTTQRWGFEAVLDADQYAKANAPAGSDGEVLSLKIDSWSRVKDSRNTEAKCLLRYRFDPCFLDDVFFPQPDDNSPSRDRQRPSLALAGLGLLCFLTAYLVFRHRTHA